MKKKIQNLKSQKLSKKSVVELTLVGVFRAGVDLDEDGVVSTAVRGYLEIGAFVGFNDVSFFSGSPEEGEMAEDFPKTAHLEEIKVEICFFPFKDDGGGISRFAEELSCIAREKFGSETPKNSPKKSFIRRSKCV